MKKEEEKLKGYLRELFAATGLAVLATQKEGAPYCSLVAFVADESLGRLMFSTSRSTRKFANLQAEPRVSLLIDNRSNRPSDFRDAMAATATGKVFEVEGEERARLTRLYLDRHPHLEEFVTAPTSALLAVEVDTYYIVRRFQHVMELHFPK
jgi:nitroimidazol reductase NimA-like FMN-containing flavoprotein (pyridoxamine 5'-phosphate oxidase superfamily)